METARRYPLDAPAKAAEMTATWDNSPELEQSVKAELVNWGLAYQGGWPSLGYNRQQPFYTPPRDRRDLPPPRIEPDWSAAERTEAALRAWSESTATGRSRYAKGQRNLQRFIIERYIWRRPGPKIAKLLHVSNSRVRQMHKESLQRYWEISNEA